MKSSIHDKTKIIATHCFHTSPAHSWLSWRGAQEQGPLGLSSMVTLTLLTDCGQKRNDRWAVGKAVPETTIFQEQRSPQHIFFQLKFHI
jgi:hypothetical protein